MRWTVRGVSREAVEEVRTMAEHFGSQGAVLEAAIHALYESDGWPRVEEHDELDWSGFLETWEEWNRDMWRLIEQLRARGGDPTGSETVVPADPQGASRC